MKPALRFNKFNDSWSSALLEELFDFKNGIGKGKEYFGYGVPIINFNQVYHLSSIKKDDIKGLVDASDSEKKRFSTRKGDVFFTRTSESIIDIGMTSVLVEDIPECVFSGFVLRARPINQLLHLQFKKYCFSTQNVRKQITSKSSMTTRALTSGSLLNKVRVFFPSIEEQQKIASFLTSVDDKINLLTKKKELLDQYKKGIVQKIFSQEIRFKDDNGNSFPDWVKGILSDYIKIKGGFAFKSLNFKKDGIPVIRISNISNHTNKLDLNNLVFYEKLEDDKNFIIKRGNLLIALSGATTGKASISDYKGKAYLNQRVGLFKLTNDNLDYGFLTQFVFSNLFKKELKKVLVAGAQPNISTKDIEMFSFISPCKKEQIKISRFLSSLDKKIELLKSQIDKTKEFKKGLLQQMFV